MHRSGFALDQPIFPHFAQMRILATLSNIPHYAQTRTRSASSKPDAMHRFGFPLLRLIFPHFAQMRTPSATSNFLTACTISDSPTPNRFAYTKQIRLHQTDSPTPNRFAYTNLECCIRYNNMNNFYCLESNCCIICNNFWPKGQSWVKFLHDMQQYRYKPPFGSKTVAQIATLVRALW